MNGATRQYVLGNPYVSVFDVHRNATFDAYTLKVYVTHREGYSHRQNR